MIRPVVRLLLALAALWLCATPAVATDPPPTPFVYTRCLDVASFVLVWPGPTVSVCHPLTG